MVAWHGRVSYPELLEHCFLLRSPNTLYTVEAVFMVTFVPEVIYPIYDPTLKPTFRVEPQYDGVT